MQLSQYFEKQSRGREGWESHGIRSKRFDEEGNLLVFGYLAQPKDMWQVRIAWGFGRFGCLRGSRSSGGEHYCWSRTGSYLDEEIILCVYVFCFEEHARLAMMCPSCLEEVQKSPQS